MYFYMQAFIEKNHWSCLRPLVSVALSMLGTHWGSSCIFCCCLVSWSSCNSGSTGLMPSHPCAPADHRCGDVAVVNPDIGGNEATYLSSLLISFASLDMLLPQDMNYFVSVSHIRPQACMWVSLSLLECHGPGWDYASSPQKDHNSA